MNEVRNILMGFEIDRNGSQISYYDRRSGEPVSVPVKVGTNLYTFPTSLCKMAGKDEWHFGLEADYFGSQNGGILIPDFFDVICGEDSLTVDGKLMKPSELLGIYLRQSLALTGVKDVLKAISQITVTTENLTKAFVDNLREAGSYIGLEPESLAVQSYMESFFYYTYSQKTELCARDVALMTFAGDKVSMVSLTLDRTTRPSLVRLIRGGSTELPQDDKARDEAFRLFAESEMNRRLFSTIYICGDGFDTAWAKHSVNFLCQMRRHVFSGENLYVRGACYASLDRKETHRFKNLLFMGDDLVRMNLGMEMIVRGTPSYFPLIAAGQNWFDAGRSCEIILDNTDFLAFSLNAMNGRDKKLFRMDLPGLPGRPNRTTRLRLSVILTSPTHAKIEVEDLGFGGFYPPAGLTWEEEMDF